MAFINVQILPIMISIVNKGFSINFCLVIVSLLIYNGFSSAKRSQNKNSFTVVKEEKMIWGIMGHPLSQEAYLHQEPQFKNDISDQLNLLKECGLSWYRVDVPTDTNGNVQNYYRFEELKKIAIQKKITLLPLIYLVGLDYKKTALEMYNLGFKCGKNFAVQHGRYFNYYELGNEQEQDLLVVGWKSAGDTISDYDPAKMKVLAGYFKGLIAGIKLIRPNAKVIINTAGWVHFAFFEGLINQKVNFDIIGYHWYSDMGKFTDVRDYKYNMGNLLYEKFKRPIWITEISKRDGSNSSITEQEQANWDSTYIQEAKSNRHIQAVFFYELYDQPVFTNSEGNYGIIKWKVKYSDPIPKLAFQTIKREISYN